ncbi:MAG: hypothetical protein GY906_07765 [bacterium]|nr:hypothetical protein [bacterium]
MPFTIEYDSERACMMCKLSGTIDIQLITCYIDKVVSLMEQHHCSRVLNDVRGADISLSSVDIVSLPNLMIEKNFNRFAKRALVYDQSSDDIEFFETVSTNRGHKVRVFTDFEQALNWLTE